MPRAIDVIIDHWRATRSERGKIVGFVHGGKPGLEIHWGPWTIGEQDRVFGSFDVRQDPETKNLKLPPAAFARILLVKAEDKDGKLLFQNVEETELLSEANPREVQRIATRIMLDLAADNAAGATQRGEEDGTAPKAPPSVASPGAAT